jgi:hypothetical protein
MHGPEGQSAWENPAVIKVIPSRNNQSGNNIVSHPYREGKEQNKYYERLLFDPHEPLLRGPHKTLTFAIQWLHVSGVKNIIFAGNDLEANTFEEKYSYKLSEYDNKKKHNFKKTLDQIKNALVAWYPIAQSKGYNWYSWECGEIFEKFVPVFDKSILNSVKKNNVVTPVVIPDLTDLQKKMLEQNEVPVKPQKKIQTIEESSFIKSANLFTELLNQNKQKQKTNKINDHMNLYFDMLHKRKK